MVHIVTVNDTKLSGFKYREYAINSCTSNKEYAINSCTSNKSYYIRLWLRLNRTHLLLCGTDRYDPKCRTYNVDKNKNLNISNYIDSDGVAMVSKDPNGESQYVYTDEGILTAVNLPEPIIQRNLRIATEFSDHIQLRDSKFLQSFKYGKHVYFFFQDGGNANPRTCKPKRRSQVARVCMKDEGWGDGKFLFWTSFIKANLVCLVQRPKTWPLDVMQSLSDVIHLEKDQDNIIYALFTLYVQQPSSYVAAVCSYSMKDIKKVLRTKSFKTKNKSGKKQRPSVLPGTCLTNHSNYTKMENTHFLKKTPLKIKSILPRFGGPLHVELNTKDNFTKLAVDSQVKLVNGDRVDVIFIYSDQGHCVLKLIIDPVTLKNGNISSTVIEKVIVYAKPTSINDMKIVSTVSNKNKLIIITDDEVKAIPVERCAKYVSCSLCVISRDPYCAWNKTVSKCHSHWDWNDVASLIQDVSHVNHSLCGEGNTDNRIRSKREAADIDVLLDEKETTIKYGMLTIAEYNLPKIKPIQKAFSNKGDQEGQISSAKIKVIASEEDLSVAKGSISNHFRLLEDLQEILLILAVTVFLSAAIGVIFGYQIRKKKKGIT